MIQLKDLHSESNEDLKKVGVYTITNLITNKIYVGSTKNSFYERWRLHFKSLKNNNHHSKKLQFSVNKYGLNNFKFEILEITEREIANNIEQYWLNILNPIKLGYNVSYSVNGGCFGCKMSELNKLKISKANKNNKHHLNHKHEEDVKLKIKTTLKNFYKENSDRVNYLKNIRKENMIKLNRGKNKDIKKKPIIQLDLISGEKIKEWDSAKSAGIFLGKDSSPITAVCRGKGKSSYGFKWMYKQ